MSGEPSSGRRRSARLAAKSVELTYVDEDGETPSRRSVEAGTFATTSDWLSTVNKRNVACKSPRVAPSAKKPKNVQDDEVGLNTRTKGEDLSQRVSRRFVDIERPKRGRQRMILAETFPKREKPMATRSPVTARRPRTRAELAPREPSWQVKRVCRRSSLTSCITEASEGVASSSSSYHTAKEIASNTGSTTLEKEDDALPTPPLVEVETKLGRLGSVWRWLMANDGA